jgi:uncharacterized lipoprotein YmbA
MKTSLSLFAALLVTAACSSSPPMRYYTLSEESASPNGVVPTTRLAGAPYAIDAVIIPDLLDRPQIVLRTSTNAVEMLDDDRWASPLPDQLERVLAADLTARLGADAVIDPGLPTNSRAGRRITVSILEFDPGRSRESTLEVSWEISEVKSGLTVAASRSFRARHVAPATGSDVADIVRTMSGLIAASADDIAASIVAESPDGRPK